MPHRFPRSTLLSAILLPCAAIAQGRGPSPLEPLPTVDRSDSMRLETERFLLVGRGSYFTDLERPTSSASRLDLKSPGKAQREYDRGYQALLKDDLQGAIQHLTKSIAAYPKFVAAHEALGVAYLKLGQNQQARDQFAQAVALDNHLPDSFLNLGCAQLALKEYADAENSIRTAATIAPLDNQVQVALAFAEYVNKDYPAVLVTTRQVHERMHDGAAKVHLYAAAASEAQGDFPAARREMETLLKEDPLSDSGERYRKILEQIEATEQRRAARLAAKAPRQPTPEEIASRREFAEQQEKGARQIAEQEDKEARQIAEAEAAPDPTCLDCQPSDAAGTSPEPADQGRPAAHPTFRVSADEVSVLFAATQHGKSVTDLAPSDIEIRDDGQPPSAILAFRNESQLPLRLGLVIDISGSISPRFTFEQEAASRFLQNVAAGKNDLAFVVAVSSTVFVVQDFTADQALTARAINELAPKGDTALWDAVAFAADKLAGHPEDQPVARVLVVISDGDDNASNLTLKQAIARAQRGEVAVYTVNSRDVQIQLPDSVGDHALRTLSEMTGGSAFKPGSINQFIKGLSELQEVIRGRYLVSYRPASFQRDDRYRTIDIAAQKDGRRLTVFARKGYYASAGTPGTNDR